jgi:23S rRNA pseudouridine955/2504/2580 synthase
MEVSMRILKIQKNDAGQRLDKFLSKAVKGLPTSLMYKFIRTKKIKVNRARADQKQILSEGDEIQLFIKDEFFDAPSRDTGALTAIKPKLNIVYEDEHVMLLHKRPGILVHDDAEGGENTLIMHVQAYLCSKGEYDPASEQSFAPALCNRIDRNTGGMVIAAKDAESLRLVNEMIREDEIAKYYLCLVHGRLPKVRDTLRGYLRKDSTNNLVSVRDNEFPGSKEIITKYRVISEREMDGEPVSLVEIELVTGRTHQIRAHMAHIGHPLLGDGKYGVNRADRQKGFKFQALYAYRLCFHPKNTDTLLGYLRGREYIIDPTTIWFTEGFDLTRISSAKKES